MKRAFRRGCCCGGLRCRLSVSSSSDPRSSHMICWWPVRRPDRVGSDGRRARDDFGRMVSVCFRRAERWPWPVPTLVSTASCRGDGDDRGLRGSPNYSGRFLQWDQSALRVHISFRAVPPKSQCQADRSWETLLCRGAASRPVNRCRCGVTTHQSNPVLGSTEYHEVASGTELAGRADAHSQDSPGRVLNRFPVPPVGKLQPRAKTPPHD